MVTTEAVQNVTWHATYTRACVEHALVALACPDGESAAAALSTAKEMARGSKRQAITGAEHMTAAYMANFVADLSRFMRENGYIT